MGKAYFAPVYDLCTREIVAWSTSESPNMAQQAELLDGLAARMPRGARPILHSDMGWQHQHAAWCGRLRREGIIQSMSRKGNCLNSACTEGLFGHLKDEFSRGNEWPDFGSFEADLDSYVRHWNARRSQGALGSFTLEEFRESFGAAA